MLLSGNVMLLSGNVMLLIKKFNNSKTAENRHFFKAIFRRKQDIKQVRNRFYQSIYQTRNFQIFCFQQLCAK